MDDRRRTIVMLCSHRSGSTALFRMFQKHPDAGVCHVDPAVRNWEPNFWNLAAEALDGDASKLRERLAESHPFLEVPDAPSEEQVFFLWERILDRCGPIVFDKSPRYLSSFAAFEPEPRPLRTRPLDLLQRYRERGNDVRIFAIVRDPRDVISSQVANFDSAHDDVRHRVPFLLDQYANLERFRREQPYVPVFRYEDVSAAPGCYAPMMLHFCELEDHPESYDHLRPVHVGRHQLDRDPRLRRLSFPPEFEALAARYGYSVATPSAPIAEFGRALLRVLSPFGLRGVS